MRTSLIFEFEKTCFNCKNDIAIEEKDKQYTFGMLRESAIIVSKKIEAIIGIVHNDVIAVYMNKSFSVVAANLGVLYSGNAFMNLDVKNPSERINNILAKIQPKAIITNDKYAEKIVGICGDIPVINLDEAYLEEQVEEYNISLDGIIDTDPFCVINTSGSTGTPKGVVLNHRSFFDFLDWSCDTFDFSKETIIGSLSPIVFDIFVFEFCLLMTTGAHIVILEDTLAIFPIQLLQRMSEKRVNYIFWVPSIMVNIANENLLEKVNLENLKLVWFAGEVFPTRQFNYWFDQLPRTKFVNMYGPIEITLDCTYYIVEERPDENSPIPIGKACRNTDVLILNENDEICREGEEGELCVRGSSLAMGYYNSPEKTKLAFVQNPLNKKYPEMIYRTGDIVYVNDEHNIVFKGRKDSLIKHMGYRIELSEIEHIVISGKMGIEYCCAVYDKKNKKIVLFYETLREVSEIDIRRMLLKVLPKYMVPSEYIRLDSIPQNANGKIDRQLLNEKVNGRK